jgi:fatty acid synthase subunit alpha
VSKDADTIYHHAPEPTEAASEPVASVTLEAATAGKAGLTEDKQTQSTSSPPPAVSTPSTSIQQLEDVGVSALDIIRAIVAQKLRKSFEELPVKSSIKDLVGGVLNIFPYTCIWSGDFAKSV